MRWRPRSVRARLTLLYALVLALLLLGYAGSVYAFLHHRLWAELDRTLAMDFEFAEALAAGVTAGHDHADDARRIEVRSPDGAILLRHGPEGPPLPPPAPDGSPSESVTLTGGERVRTRSGPYDLAGGKRVWIRVARSEERVRHDLSEFALVAGLGLPLAVAALCAAGWFLARRTLAPVDRLVSQARSITAERLSERLPVENPDDELGRLAATFNETFARLQRSFDEMRRFTADAAHELRTPLTALRSVGEVCLREPRADASYRDAIGSILEEADRMARLVDALLRLARADGGAFAARTQRVDLPAFARDAAERMGALADENGQRFAVYAEREVAAHADPDLLWQAVSNVLDNAVRHGPPGEPIDVRVEERGGAAVLEITDRGPGLAPEHQERVFERFFRVDEARARGTGGAGLGLAIARWAVEAQGGRIEVESAPGAGATFRIALPIDR